MTDGPRPAPGGGVFDGPWTVIVTVEAEAHIMPDLEAHAALGLDRFRTYPGFLGGSLHVSRGGDRLIQHTRWASEGEYDACIHDSAWDALPSTRTFLHAVETGLATMKVDVFRVVKVVDSGRA